MRVTNRRMKANHHPTGGMLAMLAIHPPTDSVAFVTLLLRAVSKSSMERLIVTWDPRSTIFLVVLAFLWKTGLV
jgi:CBS-domain-containing membrane protein